MTRKSYKFLTLFLIILFSRESFSVELDENVSISQQKMKLNLRWNIFSNKDFMTIDKKGTSVFIKTLNPNVLSGLKQNLKDIKVDNKYIKEIKIREPKELGKVSFLEIKLNGPDVELFTFYRDSEKKYVLDFWIDEETSKKVVENNFSVKKIVVDSKNNYKKPASSIPKLSKKKVKKYRKKKKSLKPKKALLTRKTNPYRDFRYGASFVWDFPPLMPELPKEINLDRKTPEFLYPVKNRTLKAGNQKEAHLQLAINLYRKRKWGLMYKSIKLYQRKYGENESIDLLDYLKANALLGANLEKGNREPEKMAMAILSNIVERTKDYEFSKAINKYILAHMINLKEYVQALHKAKKIYLKSKKNFDYEESEKAANIIFYCLAKLHQNDKIKELAAEATIQKIIPKQMRIAYELYVNISRGDPNEVIREFEKHESGLIAPIERSILYNVAESYFRLGKYKKAIGFYDKFSSLHSYHPDASTARLRMAMAYELLDRPMDETLSLYKMAIDRSSKFEIGYEAKIRYVGIRVLRKRNPTKFDKETEIFLRNGNGIKLNAKLKKLLWLVRMRILLVNEKFEEALAYLNALPLDRLKPSERRVFNADGAEVIYGVLLTKFKNADYARLIKVWEIYKSVYIDKVATDSFINYIAGKSFLKLGLYDGFERVYQGYKKMQSSPPRTYPFWVKRTKGTNAANLLTELSILRNLKLKKWDLAKKSVSDLEQKKIYFNKLNYFKGVIAFQEKDYNSTIKHFEKYLSGQKRDDFYDPSEIAEVFRSYADSLYQNGNLEKYKKVTEALLTDTLNYADKNPFMNEVKEKVSYMTIEILSGEKKDASYLLLESKIKGFKKRFKKSIYLPRLDYLLGISYVETKRVKEGKKIFNSLIKKEEISNYLKELARSELSLLQIKESTI